MKRGSTRRGAPFLRAHRARRFCSPKGLLFYFSRTVRECALRGIFSFSKENIPLTPPRERLRLAVSGLNDFYASGVEVPAWRHCFARRQWFCKTICLCSYHPLLRSRWRLCCLTDAAHPLRVPLCTALALRSVCSPSSCKLPMCGVKGQGPLRSLGGLRGIFSHMREYPPYPVQRLRRCLPRGTSAANLSHLCEQEGVFL